MTSGQGDFGSTEYATAAANRDRSVAVVYIPASRPLTLDLSRFGAVRARWFDPTSGTYTRIDLPDGAAGKRRFTPP